MISRRRFIKLAGAGAAAMIAAKARLARADLPLPPFPPDTLGEDTLISFNEVFGYPPMLGRLTANRMRVFAGPSPRSESIRNVYLHAILPIYAAVRGEPYDIRTRSEVWYNLGQNDKGQDEYDHTRYVAPTKEVFNEPEPVDDWWWGQVTVPLTNQHYLPAATSYRYTWDFYRGFYTQLHRVVGSAVDDEGRHWYRIEDDIEPDRPAWMLGRTLRRVHP
ncbi:MAG: twin-arginine translocation signal domain-containing protein, partial [Anaerolineae bacterium]